jgi:hypothetical protein
MIKLFLALLFVAASVRSQALFTLDANYMNYTSCTRDYDSCDNATGVCIISTGHKLGLCVPECTNPAYTTCYEKQKWGIGVATATSVCEGGKCNALPAEIAESNCTVGQVCDDDDSRDPDAFGECVVTLVQGKLCGSPSCTFGAPCWFSRTQRGICSGPSKNLITCELPCTGKAGDRCTGHAETGSTRFFDGVCDANKTCVDQCPRGAAGDATPCYLRIDSTSKSGTCDSQNGYCAPPPCVSAGDACFDSVTRTGGLCGALTGGQFTCVSPVAIASQPLGGSCTLLEANFTATKGWVTGAADARVCERKPECVCVGGSCVDGKCDAPEPIVVTTTTAARTAKSTTASPTGTNSAISKQVSASAFVFVLAVAIFQ